MEPLRIHLFGGFLLEQDGRALPPIPSRAGRALFAHLAVHRGRHQMRDYLAGLFWPDLTDVRARRRLSHTLWQIQDALGEAANPQPYVLATGDTLAFNVESSYWLDVEEFQHGLSEVGLSHGSHALGRAEDLERLRSCIDLYRGDFLAGFYEDWVLVEQEHLRELYLLALSQVMQLSKGQGNYDEALAYARRLTHHDPLREEAHQEVMRLCFLQGRTNEALQQYERCRSILADELGAEPSGVTTELYRKISRQRRAGIRPAEAGPVTTLFRPRHESPFVGRELERRALIDGMERVLSGRGGALLVEGEPGVGKTRLVVEAVEDARWRGFEVLWGECREGGQPPFHPITEALGSGITRLRAEQLAQRVDPVWLREVARLVPPLAEWLPLPSSAPLRGREEPQRMREAVARTLLGLGEIAPHLLVIDDLQWADDDTVRVLTHLSQALADRPVLMVLNYRAEEGRRRAAVWEAIREVDRSSGLGRVLLGPLSAFEVGELVKRSLGIEALAPRMAVRLHEEAGGNPLFTLETLHALRDEGVIQDAGTRLSASIEQRLGAHGLPLADRVREVIGGRISSLGKETADVLGAAAVAGVADLELLVAVSGSPRPAVADAVDELVGRNLLVEAESGFTFRHDQIRQVAYRIPDARRRRRLHRRVALALEARDETRVEELAHHFVAGGAWEQAAGYLEAAARRAEDVHAYETALGLYRRADEAAERAGLDPARRFSLAAAEERLLDVLGLRDRQGEVLERMAGLVGEGTPEEAELLRRRSWFLAHLDHFEAAGEQARSALLVAEQLGDPAGRAAALTLLGTILAWSGRADEAAGLLEVAVAGGQEDGAAEAEARVALGSALGQLQSHEAAEEQLERALALYHELGDSRGEAEALGMLGIVRKDQGRVASAEETYQRALAICREIGYRHGEGVNLVNLANVLYVQKRVGDSLEAYEEAGDIFRAIGNRRGEAMVLVNAAEVRHRLLGDDARAEREATAALRFFEGIGDEMRQAHCVLVLAGVDGRTRRVADARRRLEAILERLQAPQTRRVQPQVLSLLAQIHLEEGRSEVALEILGSAEAVAAQVGAMEVAPELASVRGLALLHAGEPDAALAASRQATEMVEGTTDPAHVVWFRHYLVCKEVGADGEAEAALSLAREGLLSVVDQLGEDERERALTAVPEHAAIEAAWRRERPRRVAATMVDATVPVGRAVDPAEWREVELTVEAPEDQAFEDEVQRRRHRMLRLLREAEEQGVSPTISDLARTLGVSRSTVRRDLAALREEGRPVRTRGSRSAAG